ncbi:hypothetical protein A2V68_01740 [candidate division Kazan bacterium RBG_13_50_9]|uniref:Methyltransferase small domain-containing protein n=1 Tax=candidate division Kazan bacterium RBG_13_50_9 TaxID=1798535 RepID=A0A1F4NU73_UNCK3|nr:MAG: hypothetical protein A2V68_01740 [candidate division Kazan bacterium RBG_13_50_9]
MEHLSSRPEADPREGYNVRDRFAWFEIDAMWRQQDAVLEVLNVNGTEPRMVSIPEIDREFIVLPGVFSPEFPDARLLARAVGQEIVKGERVLDLGTGCGIQGIMAAKKGARVLATDISPKAVKCAQMNTRRYGVKNFMEVREGDLFDGLDGKRFDAIIFNPPFRPFRPRCEDERASLDEDYATLRRFFAEARDHLNEDGRIISVFSNSGDLQYFESLVDASGYQRGIITSVVGSYTYNAYRLTVPKGAEGRPA